MGPKTKKRRCKCAAKRWKGPERQKDTRCESAFSRIDDKLRGGNARLKASLKCSASRTSIEEACCSSQIKCKACVQENALASTKCCPSTSYCSAALGESPLGCDEASQIGNSFVNNCIPRGCPRTCCDTKLNTSCLTQKQPNHCPAQSCANLTRIRAYKRFWKRFKRACSKTSTTDKIIQLHYNPKNCDKSVNTSASCLTLDYQIESVVSRTAGILKNQKITADNLDSCRVQISTALDSPSTVKFLNVNELTDETNQPDVNKQPRTVTDSNNKKSSNGFFKALWHRQSGNKDGEQLKVNDKLKDKKRFSNTEKSKAYNVHHEESKSAKLLEKGNNTDDNLYTLSKLNNVQSKCIGTNNRSNDNREIILRSRTPKCKLKIDNLSNGIAQCNTRQENISTLEKFEYDRKCMTDNLQVASKSNKIILDCRDFVFCKCSRGKSRCSQTKLKVCHCHQQSCL